MCKVRSGVLLVLCVFCVTSVCTAFDGNRKGFVLGGGVGFSPYVDFTSDNIFYNDNGSGISGNFMIGFAPNNFNMFVIEMGGSEITKEFLGNKNPAAVFFGPVWYHYYYTKTKIFSVIGGGLQLTVHESRGTSGG